MNKSKLANKLKQKNGITLIALVITIIVLLILAGVSISAITGNESAMEKAQQAKTENEKADELDTIKLAVVDAVAHGTDGYVTLENLQDAVKNLDGISVTNGDEARTFKITGKKGNYIVYANGNVKEIDGTESENVEDIEKLTLGKYVRYTTKDPNDPTKTKTIDCQVLYNDSTHGLQIISTKSVETVVLGKNDPNYTTGTDVQKAQNSFNYVIKNLNNIAKKYQNTSDNGLTLDARCVGSVSTAARKKFANKNDESGTFTGSYSYLSKYRMNGRHRDTDTHYGTEAGTDWMQMTDAIKNIGEEYWLASRLVESYSGETYFRVRNVGAHGGLTYYNFWYGRSDGIMDAMALSSGFRPVFLLTSDIEIDQGTGELNSPYVLHALEKEPEPMISFSVNGDPFEVPEGYTWKDAVDDEIFPENYYIYVNSGYDEYVRLGEGTYISYNGNPVYGNDLIENKSYLFSYCCFDPDMQVLMADKTTKNIQDVEEGDKVMSLNEDTGEFIAQKVTKKIIKEHSDDLVYVYLSNGKKIGMRAYHPLLTENGWKSLRPKLAQTTLEAGEKVELLQVGDKLIGYGDTPTIVSIEYREPIENYNTYNLSVEGYHNYIVENIVVHNAGAPCK